MKFSKKNVFYITLQERDFTNTALQKKSNEALIAKHCVEEGVGHYMSTRLLLKTKHLLKRFPIFCTHSVVDEDVDTGIHRLKEEREGPSNIKEIQFPTEEAEFRFDEGRH